MAMSRASLSHSSPLPESESKIGNFKLLEFFEPVGTTVGQSDCLNPSLIKESPLPTAKTKGSSSQNTKWWSEMMRERDGIKPCATKASNRTDTDFGKWVGMP